MEKSTKAGLVALGAAVAGSFILLNPKARNKVKDTSVQVKDSVNHYARTIKEDPQGTKEALIEKIRNTTDTSKEKVAKIQLKLEQQAKNLKQSAVTILDKKETKREDEENATENLIEGIQTGQDEITEHLSKDMHQLDSKTITNRPIT